MTKPTDEPEDPATKEPDPKKATASWFTFRRTMVVGGALSIGWGAAVLLGRWFGWWDEGASGTLGDSFAPLLGLLTVVALAAALDSVRMQREELQLQRRELELTRKEMAKQREAAQAQAAEVKRANELAEASHRIAEKANELAADRSSSGDHEHRAVVLGLRRRALLHRPASRRETVRITRTPRDEEAVECTSCGTRPHAS